MGFQSMPYTQPIKGKPLSCDTISDIAGDEPFKKQWRGVAVHSPVWRME